MTTRYLLQLLGRDREPSETMRWDLIMGLAWKANFRWCIQASRRKRNYIIDAVSVFDKNLRKCGNGVQTNVSLHSRRRRMLPFQDFSRKCVFLMPSEEIEMKRRLEQEIKTGLSMPGDVLLEMKGLIRCFVSLRTLLSYRTILCTRANDGSVLREDLLCGAAREG